MKKIIETANAILKARKQIEENRKIWEEQTKPLLKEVFDNLKKDLPFPLDYQNNGIKGYESVIYSLGRDYSGILEVKPSVDSRAYLKDNGYLVFGIMHNGYVAVVYSKPKIEELVSNTVQNQQLATVSPSELTEAKILDFFSTFLNEVLAWELDKNPSKPVGFALSPKPTGEIITKNF